MYIDYMQYVYILCIYEHKIILPIYTSMYYMACMKSKIRMSKDIA